MQRCFSIGIVLLAGILLTNNAFAVIQIHADVPVIRLDPTAVTTWEKRGQMMGDAVKAEFPNIEHTIDSYLADLVEYQQAIFDNYIRRMPKIRDNISQAYVEEVNGLYSRFTSISATSILGDGLLSHEEFWGFQLIPDIGRWTNCSGFGVFGDYSSSGKPIVGRNLDWPVTNDAKQIQAIIVYQWGEGVEVVNIGFAGFLGVITGYNSSGLFAGIFDSDMGGAYPTLTNQRSYVFDLRYVLESFSSIADASTYLSSQPYAFSHNILLADKTDVHVLEHPEGVNAQLRTATTPLRSDISWGKTNQIAVVNFFVSQGFSNGARSWNYDRWDRLRTLAKFDDISKATVDEVKSVMHDTANGPYNQIFNRLTVQSMVFTPSDGASHGHLHLSITSSGDADGGGDGEGAEGSNTSGGGKASSSGG